MKLLIIGGVAGGASAAARARRLDESAEIVLLQVSKFNVELAERNCQVHLLTPIVVFYALHSPVQM
jgi:NADPH-dependent 2,4-dienoyl-CoA reductase/sulfur reductase-like enzyme